MKTIKIDGVDHTCFLEQSHDGGVVINMLVPREDGTVDNYRHWYQDPEHARQVFDGMDEAEVRQRGLIARQVTAGFAANVLGNPEKVAEESATLSALVAALPRRKKV